MSGPSRAPYRLDTLVRPMLIGAAYFAVAVLALRTTRFDGGFAFLWVANAILLAELLIVQPKHWAPTILCSAIGGMIATAVFGLGLEAAVPMAVANVGEAAFTAYVWWRLRSAMGLVESLPTLALFMAIAGIVSPALSGVFAAAALALTAGHAFAAGWFNWYAGHALGAVTFTPVLTMILRGEVGEWFAETSRVVKIETAALIALFVVVTAAVFSQNSYPLLFLPILPLAMVTFRAGRLGASIAIVLLAVIGGALTMRGYGPMTLVHGTAGERAQFFQFYIGTCFLIALPASVELAVRRRLYEQLVDSEARYRLFADNSGDVIMNLSIDGMIRYVSPSVTALGGYQPAELIGTQVQALVEPDDLPDVVEVHRRALATPGRSLSVQYRGRTRTGELRWFETSTRAIADGRGVPLSVVSAIRDISDRKSLEMELSTAANTDPLTGVHNRRSFLDALQRRIGSTTEVARGCVALLDLDHFKRVNDTHGHAAGDAVLKGFVDRIRPGLRASDVIGRLGGEEFALILWDAGLPEAEAACERLLAMVAETRLSAGESCTVPVTFSIGLTEINGMRTAAELLDTADKALYQAKAGGRNCLRLAA